MTPLNMDRVRESFEHRKAGEEAVYLRIYRDATKKPSEVAQINQVYELALELSGKTDAEVERELDDTSIPQQQVRVYAMCGNGFLGRFAAEQPKDFYIDDRVGRLPAKRLDIYREVKRLEVMIGENDTPQMPTFHSCGVS